MSTTKKETLAADGSTAWMPLGQWGNRVEVRAEDWAGTSAELEFSTDANDDAPDSLETLTAGDAFDIDGPGYVRVTATGVNDALDLLVTPKARA
jgi:hypothetical protein